VRDVVLNKCMKCFTCVYYALLSKFLGKSEKKQVQEDQVYELAVIFLEKGDDMAVLDNKDELVRLGVAESEQSCFLWKVLECRGDARDIAAGRTISYFFATRMGHSFRTKRKSDGPTSSKDLIVNLKIHT
jgi:hypothetical protein